MTMFDFRSKRTPQNNPEALLLFINIWWKKSKKCSGSTEKTLSQYCTDLIIIMRNWLWVTHDHRSREQDEKEFLLLEKEGLFRVDRWFDEYIWRDKMTKMYDCSGHSFLASPFFMRTRVVVLEEMQSSCLMSRWSLSSDNSSSNIKNHKCPQSLTWI